MPFIYIAPIDPTELSALADQAEEVIKRFHQTTPATPWPDSAQTEAAEQTDDVAEPAEDTTEQGDDEVNEQYAIDAAICRRFNYHPPRDEKTREAHEHVRSILHAAAHDLTRKVPASPERDVAITKLDEAMFWANAAVARNQP